MPCIKMTKVRGRGSVDRCAALVLGLLFTAGCTELRVPDPNVRYIAFGDSATAGPSTRDYPDILRELLGQAPETFANQGRGGETSKEGLVRFELLLSGQIFPNAEVLFYWQGGNDITDFIEDHDPFLLFSPDDPAYPYAEELSRQLDDTQANIESVIELAREAGLKVLIVTYYFLREDFQECEALPLDIIFPPQAELGNAYIARLNERIRTVAAQMNVILVDLAAEDEALRSDRQNYFNCNHLSEQGNEIVADLFFQEIAASTR